MTELQHNAVFRAFMRAADEENDVDAVELRKLANEYDKTVENLALLSSLQPGDVVRLPSGIEWKKLDCSERGSCWETGAAPLYDWLCADTFIALAETLVRGGAAIVRASEPRTQEEIS